MTEQQFWKTALPVSRDALVTGSLRAIGVGLLYLVQVALARWLGAAGFGVYSFATTWAFLLSVIAAFGLPLVVLRFLPKYDTENAHDLARGLLRRAWQIPLALGVALGSAAAVVVGLLALAGRGNEYTVPLLVAFLLVPVWALMTVQTAVYQAERRFVLAFSAQDLLHPGLLGLGCALVAWQAGLLPARALLVSFTAMVAVVVVRRVWRAPRAARHAAGVAPQFATRTWLRVGGALMLVGGFGLMLSHTDIVVLGLFRDPVEVGLYKAASRSANLTVFFLTAINAAATPRFSRLLAESRKAELSRLLRPVAHLIFWPSVAVSAVLVAGSGIVLALFGEEFVAARWTLIVLSLAQLVNAGAGSVGILLNLSGHQDDCARVYGLTALINLVLNLLAVPVLGTLGAALATAVAIMTWNVWLHVLVVRRLGLYPSIVYAGRSR